MTFTWQEQTRPFFDSSGNQPAHFVLEQVSDKAFRLRAPFRFAPTDGEAVDVTDDVLGDTDFASIPSYMQWFVTSTGRHTPAALVHDQLVAGSTPIEARMQADRTFLRAMDELGVPPVRGRVMWSATALATRLCYRPWGMLGIFVWIGFALAGTWLLLRGVAEGNWWIVAFALIGPLPTSALWGRQFWAGIVGGYAIWVVAVPAITAIGAYYLIYWPIEQAVRLVRTRLPQNRNEEVPGPTTYKAA